MAFRIGYGYDVHQLAEGESFWLGGIEVPHTHGAVGHSDADVLLHVPKVLTYNVFLEVQRNTAV